MMIELILIFRQFSEMCSVGKSEVWFLTSSVFNVSISNWRLELKAAVLLLSIRSTRLRLRLRLRQPCSALFSLALVSHQR